MVYPSQEFKDRQHVVLETQSDMFEEAQEHYRLIQTITKEDLLGYKEWDRLMKRRRREVKETLKEQRHAWN